MEFAGILSQKCESDSSGYFLWPATQSHHLGRMAATLYVFGTEIYLRCARVNCL